MQLDNKVVLVTGGSDGIGRHVCLKLAAQGCRLAILGRNARRLAGVEQECIAIGAADARAYACDIRSDKELAPTVAGVLSESGQIDVLINNAGIWPKVAPLDEVPADVLAATVETNLLSVMQLTRHVLPHLRERSEAAVLNIVSKSGYLAEAGQAVYAATKFGMRGFTDVLKKDEKESGVRVAGIYQSGTNTQMFAKAGEDVPNQRFTEPDDLADVVVFMLSRPPKLWLHDVRIEY